MPARSVGGRRLTAWSLAALVIGLALGMALHGSGSAWGPTLETALKPIGRVWVIALQICVVPLVLTQAIAAALTTERLGALGARTLALFLAMLVAAAAFTLLTAPWLISLYRVDPASIAVLRSSVTIPEFMQEGLGGGTGLGDRLVGYLPTSFIRVFQGANLLPVLVGAIVLALIARRFAGSRRERLKRGVLWLTEAAMTLVGWVLRFTPVGVFALSFGLGLHSGGRAVGLITFYVVLASGLMLAFTALLYPLTSMLSGVPIRRFMRGVAPAQLVAVSTRSSLASLPALIEGGRDRLGLPAAATGFVLPLAVSTFKVSMAVSHTVMLLFIAHAFGVPLGPDRIVVFVVSIFLFSFTVPGIPGGNPGIATLPLFLAAGVPIEGVVILDAVDAVPDIFKTITNVTADMSAATIVTRGVRSAAPDRTES